MSVVNKMLRDLESRKQDYQQHANYIPPESNKGLWAGLFVCFSGIMLLAAYLVISANEITPNPVQNSPEVIFDAKKGDQIATQSDLLDRQDKPSNQQQANLDRHDKPITQLQEQRTDQVAANEAMLASTSYSQNITNKLIVKAENASSVDVQSSSFTKAPSDGAQGHLSLLRSKAHLASEKGLDNEVIEALQQIILHAPNELRSRKQLAALLFSKNRMQEAQATLQNGILQAPADSSLRLMLARIYFKLGDNQTALDVLSAHPYDNLANNELLSFRAALAEKIGHYEISKKDYQLLVQRNPKEAKWWLGLGVSQDKLSLSDAAITSYLQAQSLNQLPDQVDSFVENRIQLLARRS